MSLAVRWIIIGAVIGLAAVALARLIGWPPPDPGTQAWMHWETCVLNGNYDPSEATARCGPMPEP